MKNLPFLRVRKDYITCKISPDVFFISIVSYYPSLSYFVTFCYFKLFWFPFPSVLENTTFFFFWQSTIYFLCTLLVVFFPPRDKRSYPSSLILTSLLFNWYPEAKYIFGLSLWRFTSVKCIALYKTLPFLTFFLGTIMFQTWK